MTVTMIKRRRDDLTLHLTGLVHARALFEARGATPEDMDALDHETETPSHPGLPEEFRDGSYRKLTTG